MRCMDDKEFDVGIDEETMRAVLRLIEFSRKNHPFIDENVLEFEGRLREIVNGGCFKHNLMGITVEDGPNRRVTFCPKCCPEYAKKYMSKGH